MMDYSDIILITKYLLSPVQFGDQFGGIFLF